MWHLRTVISDTSLYFAIKSLSCLCVCGKMCQGEAGVTANIIIIITRVLHLIWNLFKRMATASGCLTVSVHHHRNHHLWLPKRIFYLLFPFFCPTSHWWTGPICLSFSPFIISSLVNSVVLHFLFFFHLCLSLTHPRFKGCFFFFTPPSSSFRSIHLPPTFAYAVIFLLHLQPLVHPLVQHWAFSVGSFDKRMNSLNRNKNVLKKHTQNWWIYLC